MLHDDAPFSEPLCARGFDVILMDHIQHSRPRETGKSGKAGITQAEDGKNVMPERVSDDSPCRHAMRDFRKNPLERKQRQTSPFAQHRLQHESDPQDRQRIEEKQEKGNDIIQFRIRADRGKDAERNRQKISHEDGKHIQTHGHGQALQDQPRDGAALVHGRGFSEIPVKRHSLQPEEKADRNRFVQMKFLPEGLIARQRVPVGRHLRARAFSEHGAPGRIAGCKTHQDIAGEQNDEQCHHPEQTAFQQIRKKTILHAGLLVFRNPKKII